MESLGGLASGLFLFMAWQLKWAYFVFIIRIKRTGSVRDNGVELEKPQ